VASAALWIYRIALSAALPLAAPWLLLRASLAGKRRPALRRRFGFGLPPIPKGGVWVQAVSVGEVGVARPLLTELRRRHPALPLVLSSTTATGLASASGAQLADVVVPFPIDLRGPVHRVLDAAKPRLVVLVETELWPELLAACEEGDIPVAIANARVSDRSFRGYKALRPLLGSLLRPVTLALAQSDQDAERLIALGIPAARVRVAGNIKFDAKPPERQPTIVEELRALAAGRKVLVAGSTMAGEERIVLDALLRIPADRRPMLVLAPRHPERSRQALEEATARALKTARRTLLPRDPASCEVVILDTIGELASLYGLASIAFVGGSLVPTGGHNPIEAARFGVPILTGPHVRNFAAVYRDFLAVGAAIVVRDTAELTKALVSWLSEPARASVAGEAGRGLLAANAGATSRVAEALACYLE